MGKKGEQGKKNRSPGQEIITNWRLLRLKGYTYPQIAEKTKWDYRTVKTYLEKVPTDLKSLLAPCLTDPNLSIRVAYESYPLELYNQDWRLDPITWFYLCTPDLSEDKERFWSKAYAKFKEKMEKSGFWQHYGKLKSAAYRLQSAYKEAAPNLPTELIAVWESIQKELTLRLMPSRIPQNPEPDWEAWRPVHDPDTCKKVFTAFLKLIPDLYTQLIEMEELLQKLNDDLCRKRPGRPPKI